MFKIFGKKILLILIFLPTISYSQDTNKTKWTYFKINVNTNDNYNFVKLLHELEITDTTNKYTIVVNIADTKSENHYIVYGDEADPTSYRFSFYKLSYEMIRFLINWCGDNKINLNKIIICGVYYKDIVGIKPSSIVECYLFNIKRNYTNNYIHIVNELEINNTLSDFMVCIDLRNSQLNLQYLIFCDGETNIKYFNWLLISNSLKDEMMNSRFFLKWQLKETEANELGYSIDRTKYKYFKIYANTSYDSVFIKLQYEIGIDPIISNFSVCVDIRDPQPDNQYLYVGDLDDPSNMKFKWHQFSENVRSKLINWNKINKFKLH